MEDIKQKKDRYEMHKYWGKKPSKDLNKLINKYSKEGDVLLDPFSGYGVFCCEAYLLGRNVISNDINPISNLINKHLVPESFDTKELEKTWKIIKNEFQPIIREWFSMKINGKNVYLINTLRDKHDNPIKAKVKDEESKKTYEIVFSEHEVKEYLKFENEQIIEDWYPKNLLIENSRISAKPNMKVEDLFTKRTLACHSKLNFLIDKYSSGRENELFKLAFTANLANCSKLVPPIKTRGDMAQGAWMTGFYVGDTYIENNVLEYYENRLKKVIKGQEDISNKRDTPLFQNCGTFKVTCFDARKMQIETESIDYIFTDPPYGGAVPYLEQSIIWNSWIKMEPDYLAEIVVSDSKKRKKGVENYEKDIEQAFLEIGRVLKTNKYFSLTYHSLSGLEWRAITNACIKSGFEIVDYEWLIQKSFTPRQINRQKSIKGDILVTFKNAKNNEFSKLNKIQTEQFFEKELEEIIKKEIDTNEVFLQLMKSIFQKRVVIENIDFIEVLSSKYVFYNQLWYPKQ